ncbi:hypothetical protein NF867_07965 [Solitalea sp. MAHUQ-68]|uniref:Uncharacterized protein n=1 Tax=Solitalea agri TaxID=2953739 RepID=A0A9X2F226_9SPHI|nr:hypothetical protein [Solitalea agri]MCO4292791.1 hypothetical protein [Solitalea agri]
MKLPLWTIVICSLLCITTTFCSRELTFVRVQPNEQSTIREMEPMKKDTSINKVEIEEASSSAVLSKPALSNSYKVKQKRSGYVPQTSTSRKSLTEIYTNAAHQSKKTTLSHNVAKYSKALLPPSKPQKSKTYGGAILMGLGIAAVLIGVFANPASWWVIVLGALMFLLGAALLVSGSMSGWGR